MNENVYTVAWQAASGQEGKEEISDEEKEFNRKADEYDAKFRKTQNEKFTELHPDCGHGGETAMMSSCMLSAFCYFDSMEQKKIR